MHTLTQDQIERLEEIGFKWKIRETFEQRCRDLEAFKRDFGHCHVSKEKDSLGESFIGELVQ